MNLVKYNVLEHTCSELQADGTAFAVLLHRECGNPSALELYLLQDWEHNLPGSSVADLSLISDLINDVQYYQVRDLECVPTFFTSLETLGVGVIRTSNSGVCTEDELDAMLLPHLHPYGQTLDSWRDRFYPLLP
jgi:hypothetical protein